MLVQLTHATTLLGAFILVLYALISLAKPLWNVTQFKDVSTNKQAVPTTLCLMLAILLFAKMISVQLNHLMEPEMLVEHAKEMWTMKQFASWKKTKLLLLCLEELWLVSSLQ
jgi:hypothetical protein